MMTSFLFLSRPRASVAFLAAFLSGVGCATIHAGPPTIPLRITTGVADATVWIDDHLVGKASAFAKGDQRMPTGFHRIEVRAPGYYSDFQEVDGKADTPVALNVTLHPLLD